MKEVDIAWAAGILEGEGSFNKKGTNGCSVSCQMTDLDILERLQNIFGGSIYECKKRQEHWKDSWVWTLQKSDEAVSCMRLIDNQMGKRRQAQIWPLIAGWEQRRMEKESFHLRQLSIASAYHNGEGSTRELGRRFGVSRQAVYNAYIKFYPKVA